MKKLTEKEFIENERKLYLEILGKEIEDALEKELIESLKLYFKDFATRYAEYEISKFTTANNIGGEKVKYTIDRDYDTLPKKFDKYKYINKINGDE